MNIVHESKKFLVIGALSTVLNYALFLFLYKILGAQYVFSSVAGYLGGFIFGYIYNRSWTFKSVRPNRALELLRYFSVYLFSLALSVVVLRIGVERFVLSPLAANILAIGVSTVSNFLGSKFWVFSERAAALERRIAPLVGIPFLAILAVKIVASFLFGSHFATEGFIPFITYFVSTLDNPYDHFVGQGLNVFPYPAGMLLLESLPFFFAHYLLPSALFANLNFQLFLLKAPMLVLDILIYLVLCYLLPFKEKKVLWFYFASPILFYITYFHAQLDIVPTAFLFLSLLALFRNKETLAFILLGLGIAAKTHLLAAVPFYAIYFYRNNVSVLKIARLVLLSAACFLVVNPYLGSEGFIKSVFNNVEQQRLFNLAVPFGFQGLEFLVAPAAILFFFYKFASYKKIFVYFLV